MPASSTTGPDINTLNLSPQDLAKAKDFAQDLGIGTNDELYYYTILWCKNNLKSSGDYFIKKKREIFDKETKSQKDTGTVGPLHKKILASIVLLQAAGPPVNRVTNTQPATTQAINTARRTRTRSSALLPPKVTITLSTDEVEKGESYTVTWKSENAAVVSSSVGFGRRLSDTELNGTLSFTATRIGSKTFKITVRSSTGRPASSRAKILIVAARAAAQSQTPPRPTQTPPTPPAAAPTPTQTPAAASPAPPAASPVVATPVAPDPTPPGTNAARRRAVRARGYTTIQILTDINNSLKRIIKLLDSQSKFFEKVSLIRFRETENERRQKREGLSEMMKGGRKNIMNRTLAPIKSLFEKIINFFLFIFLGRAFTEFARWFSDPTNSDKVKTITRFLRDFWPLIGGAALYFLTPLGGLVNKLIKIMSVFVKNPGFVLGAIGGKILADAAINYKTSLDKENIEKQKSSERAYAPDYSGISGKPTKIKETTPFEKLKLFFTRFASGGLVDAKTGIKVKGAGSDTQLTVLTPGEAVLQKGARERMLSSTGIDPLSFNIGPSANRPKTLNSKLLAMSTGGVVGKKNPPNLIQSPKLSAADYNTLLAITTIEDFNSPQGRADVAQSIYNRLYAAKNYKVNFNTNDRALNVKNIITSEGQYDPVKYNKKLWLSINNRQSAAKVVAAHKKIPIDQALKTIDETDNVLRNPQAQKKAQDFVQGRTYFLGTSQLKNMRGDDVLRGPKSNFFSHWFTEGSPYHKERGKIAAPLPISVLPEEKPKIKALPQRPWYDPRNIIDKFIRNPNQSSLRPMPRQENIMPPIGAGSDSAQIINLPAISKGAQNLGESASTNVPSFSTVSPMASPTRSVLAEIYGIG